MSEQGSLFAAISNSLAGQWDTEKIATGKFVDAATSEKEQETIERKGLTTQNLGALIRAERSEDVPDEDVIATYKALLNQVKAGK